MAFDVIKRGWGWLAVWLFDMLWDNQEMVGSVEYALVLGYRDDDICT